jgi:hypothetical protein
VNSESSDSIHLSVCTSHWLCFKPPTQPLRSEGQPSLRYGSAGQPSLRYGSAGQGGHGSQRFNDLTNSEGCASARPIHLQLRSEQISQIWDVQKHIPPSLDDSPSPTGAGLGYGHRSHFEEPAVCDWELRADSYGRAELVVTLNRCPKRVWERGNERRFPEAPLHRSLPSTPSATTRGPLHYSNSLLKG